MEWSRGYHRGLPRGACGGEWSSIRCRDLLGSGGAALNPSQKVEQNHGHYYGLPHVACCGEWWSRVESVAGGGAESWPLLWPVRESRPVGRSSIEVSDGERWLSI